MADPTLPTTPSGGGLLGSVLNDSATVTGGYIPTGSITFRLYGPNNTTCAGTPIYAQTVGLSGTSAATSPGFHTAAVGTYEWTAYYSGDTNNNPASSGCGAEAVVITVPPTIPTITTALSESSGKVGDWVFDTATLYGVTANAGGTVTYTVYTNNTCTLGAQGAGTVTVTNHLVPNSNPVIFGTVGTWYWQAVYSGDGNNRGAASACTSETLVINATPHADPDLQSGNSGRNGCTHPAAHQFQQQRFERQFGAVARAADLPRLRRPRLAGRSDPATLDPRLIREARPQERSPETTEPAGYQPAGFLLRVEPAATGASTQPASRPRGPVG